MKPTKELKTLAAKLAAHQVRLKPRTEQLMTGSAQELAGIVLGENYRQLLAITTVHELEALPVGRIVIDAHGTAWQKHDNGSDPLWHPSRHRAHRADSAFLVDRGPFIVVPHLVAAAAS